MAKVIDKRPEGKAIRIRKNFRPEYRWANALVGSRCWFKASELFVRNRLHGSHGEYRLDPFYTWRRNCNEFGEYSELGEAIENTLNRIGEAIQCTEGYDIDYREVADAFYDYDGEGWWVLYAHRHFAENLYYAVNYGTGEIKMCDNFKTLWTVLRSEARYERWYRYGSPRNYFEVEEE